MILLSLYELLGIFSKCKVAMLMINDINESLRVSTVLREQGAFIVLW